MKYADETTSDPGWQDSRFDDSAWRKVTCGFGPRFWKLGPLPDGAEADLVLARLQAVDLERPVTIAGKAYRWQPYEFSWRYVLSNSAATTVARHSMPTSGWIAAWAKSAWATGQRQACWRRIPVEHGIATRSA